MYKGFDCAARLTAEKAAEFYNAGFRFVGRYFGYGSKILEPDEAKAITGAGLRLLTVFENSAEDYLGGAENGTRYGQLAKEQAEALEMPKAGIIYFAIDTQPTDFDLTAEYLLAAEKAAAPYQIGVYGSFYTIEEMAKRGIGAAFWQSYAWSDGKLSDHSSVWQSSVESEEIGIQIDHDICCDMSGAGIWSYDMSETNKKRIQTLEEVPEPLYAETKELVNSGALRGKGEGLDVTEDMLRSMIVAKRYTDKKAETQETT